MFWVPKGARWSHLKTNAKRPEIGSLIDDAMRRQQTYYDQLAAVDAQADCSGFIEFILAAIEESLHEAI